MSAAEVDMATRPTYREIELDLEVTRHERVAEGVVRVTLADPSGADLPRWTPGAHIDLLLGPSLVRQYSLCGSFANESEWTVAVLRDPASRGGSRYVHEELAKGSIVRV